MIITQPRKNRISLEDYDYREDIQHRLFLANLSVFESEVLREIVDGSLSTTTEMIADNLDIEEEEVLPVLDKLCEIGLIQKQDHMVFVDKEMRKYFEAHIVKFDDNFKPGVEFLQGLLNKVPIHVLPNWYAISKTSDHIFQSIIEKYMLTPKTYGTYLKELTFESAILNGIFHDLYQANDFVLPTKIIQDKYGLSDTQLAECILQLEYHLVCCVSYRQKDRGWEEILTPFYEWHEHLKFQRDTNPKSIENKGEISLYHPDDFGFAKDLSILLEALKDSNLTLIKDGDEFNLPEETARQLFPHYSSLSSPNIHIENLVAKLLQLKLAKIVNGELVGSYKSEDWLDKPLEEQGMLLYRHPGSCFRELKRQSISYTDRDMRETERNLRRISNKDWVYFDDFMKGFTAQVGHSEALMLINKGKRWSYNRPNYSENELQIIQGIILGRLFEAGIISMGTHRGHLCIRLTAFGKETFND